jgi:hypothetical protein
MREGSEQFTCPMHPEVVSDRPGVCPKCGMALVRKGSEQARDQGLGELVWKNYIPLVAIVGVLTVSTAALSLRDMNTGGFSVEKTISYFMIGFFLTFAAFKLMDVPGFAHGYATYDLLAMRIPQYGYLYPFIELFFGLAMILDPFSKPLLAAEFAVMFFSGTGVAIKLAKREKFACACLGTFLKVPLTYVTLLEDFGMAGLAAVMYFLSA